MTNAHGILSAHQERPQTLAAVYGMYLAARVTPAWIPSLSMPSPRAFGEGRRGGEGRDELEPVTTWLSAIGETDPEIITNVLSTSEAITRRPAYPTP